MARIGAEAAAVRKKYLDADLERRAVNGLVTMRRDRLRMLARDGVGGVSIKSGDNGSDKFYDESGHIGTEEPNHSDGHRVTFHTGRRGTPSFVSLIHTTPTDGGEPNWQFVSPVEGDIYPVLRRLNLV